MVQRYSTYGTDWECETYSDVKGELVKYEDYERLQQERDALQTLIQMAYDAPTSDEGMHWVHQGVNNLEEWMDK